MGSLWAEEISSRWNLAVDIASWFGSDSHHCLNACWLEVGVSFKGIQDFPVSRQM
jgi:hypothetical protein